MNVAGSTPTPESGNLGNPAMMATSAGQGVSFPDRRRPDTSANPVIERRQFANTHSELSEEARQLGMAIDQYKLVHRRRFITYEEMLNVIKSLGYRLDS